MRFRTTILQGDKTATGIRVPDEVVEALGAGKRPKVLVTIRGYTYRNSVAVMGGEYMIGVIGTVVGVAGSTGTFTLFGQSSVSILPDFGKTILSKYWGDGIFNAATGAFPASIHLSALNQTGSLAMRQPYFRLIGSF